MLKETCSSSPDSLSYFCRGAGSSGASLAGLLPILHTKKQKHPIAATLWGERKRRSLNWKRGKQTSGPKNGRSGRLSEEIANFRRLPTATRRYDTKASPSSPLSSFSSPSPVFCHRGAGALPGRWLVWLPGLLTRCQTTDHASCSRCDGIWMCWRSPGFWLKSG